MSDEEFKTISRHPKFEVSKSGVVRNKETLAEKPIHYNRDYQRVHLFSNGQGRWELVHRLVFEVFFRYAIRRDGGDGG